MNVTVPIPDDLAACFDSEAELGRRSFLERHGVLAANEAAGTDEGLSDRFRAFRAGKRLEGLDPVALIQEGRR